MQITQKTKEKIDAIWQQNGEIVFVAWSFLEKTEESIRYLLDGACGKDLSATFFSCIKELTTNAIKANFKELLKIERILPEPYDSEKALALLKSKFKEDAILEYGIKAKEQGLSVRVYMRREKNSLVIRIINPLPLTQRLYYRILQKIETARAYDNLAHFYIENPDPLAEGMGLGLSLVILMLKGMGLDPDLFTVSSDMKHKTVAQLILPLSKK